MALSIFFPFLLESVSKFFQPTALDDWTDKLNHYWVPFIHLWMVVFVGAQSQFLGWFRCYQPDDLGNKWDDWLRNYCFIEELHYKPFPKTIAIDEMNVIFHTQSTIAYYWSAPLFILALTAAFVIPWRIIRYFTLRAGSFDLETRVAHFSTALREWNPPNTEELDWYKLRFKYHVVHFYETLKTGQEIKRSFFSPVYFLLFTKLWYCVNVTLQMVLTNRFLGHKPTWAFEILHTFANNGRWEDHGYFPRVAFCYFSAVQWYHIPQQHRPQCILSGQMLYEKIFLILWLVYFISFFTTLHSLVKTTYRIFVPSAGKRYIKEFLSEYALFYSCIDIWTEATSIEVSDQKLTGFLEFLGKDGLMALHLIDQKIDSWRTSAAVQSLYELYINPGSSEKYVAELKGKTYPEFQAYLKPEKDARKAKAEEDWEKAEKEKAERAEKPKKPSPELPIEDNNSVVRQRLKAAIAQYDEILGA